MKAAMISDEVFVEIEVLRKHGFSLRKIAAEAGCAVSTVRRHLAAGEWPRYVRRAGRARKLAPFEACLREREAAAHPAWMPAAVLHREVAAQGYAGGLGQLRAFLRTLRPAAPAEPLARFETAPGGQMQIDWVEFRKGAEPLYAFCATLGYSRASHVVFVTDMRVETLIDRRRQCFEALGGVCRQLLHDNTKTVVLERDAYAPGEHRFHAGFLDYSRRCGFAIRLCRPCRAATCGQGGALQRLPAPLVLRPPGAARLKPAGGAVDAATANREVLRWLREAANARVHATTQARPADRLAEERAALQPLPPPWRGDVKAARPAPAAAEPPARESAPRPAVPPPHALAVYDAPLAAGAEAGAWTCNTSASSRCARSPSCPSWRGTMPPPPRTPPAPGRPTATSSKACCGRSGPAAWPASKACWPAWPASRPSRPWRISTSASPPASSAGRSRNWPGSASSSAGRTSCWPAPAASARPASPWRSATAPPRPG